MGGLAGWASAFFLWLKACLMHVGIKLYTDIIIPLACQLWGGGSYASTPLFTWMPELGFFGGGGGDDFRYRRGLVAKKGDHRWESYFTL